MNERMREARQAWSNAVEEGYRALLALGEAKKRVLESKRMLAEAEKALDTADQERTAKAVANE